MGRSCKWDDVVLLGQRHALRAAAIADGAMISDAARVTFVDELSLVFSRLLIDFRFVCMASFGSFVLDFDLSGIRCTFADDDADDDDGTVDVCCLFVLSLPSAQTPDTVC